MSDETAAQPRKVSAWKIGCGILLALLLVGIGSCVWVSCEGRRQMARIEAEAPALLAETRARDVIRAPFRGEMTPGKAWDSYRSAFKALAPLKTDAKRALRDELTKYADGLPADASVVEGALTEFNEALKHLAEGASRGDAAFGYEWEKGPGMELPGLLDSQHLGNLAAAKARFSAQAGKPREAIDALTDMCTLARDSGHNAGLINHMIALAIYGIAFNGLRDMLINDQLPKAELEELASRLEKIDASWPDMGVTYRNEALSMRMTLLGVTSGKMSAEVSGMQILGGSFIFAQAVRAYDSAMAEAADACKAGWTESQKRHARIDERTRESMNPIIKIAVPGTFGAHRSDCDRRAQLRLLRAAVHAKLGRGATVQDPFGTEIHSGPGPRLWSNGRDGVDNGGSGEWKPDREDIVLDLSKKP